MKARGFKSTRQKQVLYSINMTPIVQYMPCHILFIPTAMILPIVQLAPCKPPSKLNGPPLYYFVPPAPTLESFQCPSGTTKCATIDDKCAYSGQARIQAKSMHLMYL